MSAVWAVLGLAGVAGAAYAVLADLAPPKPPKPPKAPKPPKPPKAGPILEPGLAAHPAADSPTRELVTTTTVALPQDRGTRPAGSQAQATGARASLFDSLADTDHDDAPHTVRRVTSAVALLVMTLVVAATIGIVIYRGLLALG